jgi:patatin-like phospholipase/acyl hydrolase
MSTHPIDDMSLDQLDTATQAAKDILRRRIAQIELSRDEQPERLARARQQADEARGWALIEEPWEYNVAALPTRNSEGERTGDSLTLPNITAKETYGARLAFDMLDCGDGYDTASSAFDSDQPR